MFRFTRWTVLALVAMLGMSLVAVAQDTEKKERPRREGRGMGPGPGMGMGMGMMRMGGGMGLLENKDVRGDLKLTDEQVQKLEAIRKEMRDARPSREEMEGLSDDERQAKRKEMQEKMGKVMEQMKAVLTPEQQKRLKQIAVQAALKMAANLAMMEDVAKALNLTDEQKTKLGDIAKKTMDKMGEMMRGMRDMDEAERGKAMAEMREKGAAARKQAVAEMMEVLTPEQKKTLEELKGAEFKGELMPMMGRGMGRGMGGDRPRSDRADRPAAE